MTEITFGGRCEKHLSIKPCMQCAQATAHDRRNARAKERIYDLASIYAAKCRVNGHGEEVRMAWSAFTAAVEEALVMVPDDAAMTGPEGVHVHEPVGQKPRTEGEK